MSATLGMSGQGSRHVPEPMNPGVFGSRPRREGNLGLLTSDTIVRSTLGSARVEEKTVVSGTVPSGNMNHMEIRPGRMPSP